MFMVSLIAKYHFGFHFGRFADHKIGLKYPFPHGCFGCLVSIWWAGEGLGADDAAILSDYSLDSD